MHTYRLAAQLQALAIDNVDLNIFGTHRIPSPQHGITTIARHRVTDTDRRVLIVARDADSRLLAAASATTPLDGGPIDSHITNFRSSPIAWTRAITPPAHWWSATPAPDTTVPRNRIGFTATGHVEYYLNHDWIAGRDPRATQWTLRTWTPQHGVHTIVADTALDDALHHATTLETRSRRAA